MSEHVATFEDYLEAEHKYSFMFGSSDIEVYSAAAIEYLCSEIIKLAGDSALDDAPTLSRISAELNSR